ncbi:MAG: AraC family transcriptional regulator [Clostridia bacterium]|nr:AraC family transcriptional regulator [Clostridia bacterium]
MKTYKTRTVEYAQWSWGRCVPNFCATTIHHETELIRLVEGEGQIIINGEKFNLHKGDLYIVRPQILHTVIKTGESAPVVDDVKVDLRLLAQNCSPHSKIGDYLQFFNDKTAPCVVYGDSIRYNADKIITPLFKDNVTREQMQQTVFDLLKLLHEQRKFMHAPNITEERQHYSAQKAVEYLTANYTQQIKVADIADLVGYDEFYIMKLFKKYCGYSIVDYLNGVRTDVAMQKLLQTNDEVCDIAKEVGYNSASYFNRQFKKIFNVTPCQVRAAQNKTY